MGERKYKAEEVEKKNGAKPARETVSQVEHPILRLQQTVGNKAVANMIQREKGRRTRLEASSVNSSIIQRHPEQQGELSRLSFQVNQLWERGNVFQNRGVRNEDNIIQHAKLISANRAAIEEHKSGGGHMI